MTLYETIKAIREEGGTTEEIDAVVHKWDCSEKDDLRWQAGNAPDFEATVIRFDFYNKL